MSSDPRGAPSPISEWSRTRRIAVQPDDHQLRQLEESDAFAVRREERRTRLLSTGDLLRVRLVAATTISAFFGPRRTIVDPSGEIATRPIARLA
jgi:hypothetical protein